MDDATRSRLRKLKSECGCRAGSVAMLISVAAYIVYANGMGSATGSSGERIIAGIGVGLAAMMVGKVLGVLWARDQYRRLLNDHGG